MDLEYFKRFYEHDADNKAKQGEDEFLAGVRDFYGRRDFGVEVAGWDELEKKTNEAEILAGKGKTPKMLEGLGRLIGGEFARHKDVRRIREGELNTIAKILLRDPTMFRDTKPKPIVPIVTTEDIAKQQEDIIKELAEGLKNSVVGNKIDFDKCRIYPHNVTYGAIIYIRDELIRKRGLAEFRQEGVMPADPHKYFERDYMGFKPAGDYPADSLEQRIISLRPVKEETAYSLSGDLITIHKNDANFYNMQEIFETVGEITLTTLIILFADGTMKWFRLSPKFSTRMDTGTSAPFSLHHILRDDYSSIAEEMVSPQGKNTYTMAMEPYKMTSKQRNAYNRARMAKMEQGKKPRVSRYKSYNIFNFQGFFSDERRMFAEVNAYGAQCGIQKPGEFFDKAPAGFGLQTRWAEFVQVAAREVKEPFPHIEAIFWWDDPPTISHRPGGKMFHLFGASIEPIGATYGEDGKRLNPFKHIFLALEWPTAGVIRIPIFGPGLPLYREGLYKAYLAGKLKGLRIGGQFFTITQPHPECCALPSRTPSMMPRYSLYFGNAKPKKLEWEGNL